MLNKWTAPIALLCAAFLAAPAFAEMPMHDHSMKSGMQPVMPVAPAEDTRPLVALAPETVALLRADMRQMMSAWSDVLAALAAGNKKEAAKLLEANLGMSAMQTHPGMMRAAQELPENVRTLGMSMHQSASALAQKIATMKPAAIYNGLHEISAGCTACHMAYRVR